MLVFEKRSHKKHSNLFVSIVVLLMIVIFSITTEAETLEQGIYTIENNVSHDNSVGEGMARSYTEVLSDVEVNEQGIFETIKLNNTQFMEKLTIKVAGNQVPYEVTTYKNNVKGLRFKVPNLEAQIKVGLYVIPMDTSVEYLVTVKPQTLKLVKKKETVTKQEPQKLVVKKEEAPSKKPAVKKEEAPSKKPVVKKEEASSKKPVVKKEEVSSKKLEIQEKTEPSKKETSAKTPNSTEEEKVDKKEDVISTVSKTSTGEVPSEEKKEADRETGKEIDKEVDREEGKETDKEVDKEVGGETGKETEEKTKQMLENKDSHREEDKEVEEKSTSSLQNPNKSSNTSLWITLAFIVGAGLLVIKKVRSK